MSEPTLSQHNAKKDEDPKLKTGKKIKQRALQELMFFSKWQQEPILVHFTEDS